VVAAASCRDLDLGGEPIRQRRGLVPSRIPPTPAARGMTALKPPSSSMLPQRIPRQVKGSMGRTGRQPACRPDSGRIRPARQHSIVARKLRSRQRGRRGSGSRQQSWRSDSSGQGARWRRSYPSDFHLHQPPCCLGPGFSL